MLKFATPQLSDKEWIDKCLSNAHSMNCEYTFGNIFIWSTKYIAEVCHYKDFLIVKYGRNKNIAYTPPIGTGDFKDAVDEIIADAKMRGVKPTMYGVTVSYKDLLEINFPGKFKFSYDDGDNDYIYYVEKMATLSGKKYHGKRNHISNFIKSYPNWSFEKIDDTNINECVELHTNWIEEKADDPDYSFEFEAVLKAFENYKDLGLVGGIIRVDGKAIAYTVGERQSDICFVTHFEKAPAEINGAFAIINREFTKNCLIDYKYVNREEDLGLEGLRKAKRSYYPEIFLEKCVATYEE